jgi:membrane-bound lytic murein transglycosylase B
MRRIPPLSSSLLQTLLLSASLLLPAAACAEPRKPTRSAVSQHKATKSTKTPEAGAARYGTTEAIHAFAAEVVGRHPELDLDTVTLTLAEARRLQSVQKAIMPAASPSAKNWTAYRARFHDEIRIQGGLNFWQQQQRWLNLAEQRYGVPPQVMVAIVGIETLYGRHMGNFRLLDALATLSFDFPAGRSDRSPFFRQELEQFLVLCRRDGLDPLSVRGSYAGAMGLAQFMPGTWLKHAVDLDGDSRIDLISSPADVVGSIAAYIAANGWVRDRATHHAVEIPSNDEQLAQLLAPDIRPTFTIEQFSALGARLPDGDRPDPAGLLALVELRNGDQPSTYVAGTENFWAISRYNWSAYYTMAVIDLADTLAQRRRAGMMSNPAASAP